MELPYLRNQHLIARSHTRLYSLAFLVQCARSYSNDHRLVKLLDCALWQENTAGCPCLGFHALNEDTVEEGSEGLDGSEGGRL